VPDRYAFFMPFYCLVCILTGVGFDLLVARPNRKVLGWIVVVLALPPILTYMIAPAVAQETDFKLPTKRKIEHRNDYRWFLQPWRTGCRGPEKFAKEVFNAVEENAVIYADGTTVYALLYAQEVKKGRSDIRIVSFHPNRKNPVVFDEQTVPQLLAETSVYVVSRVPGYCPQFLLEQYEFKRVGGIWKVVNRP
jgi:hypothetical protein